VAWAAWAAWTCNVRCLALNSSQANEKPAVRAAGFFHGCDFGHSPSNAAGHAPEPRAARRAQQFARFSHKAIQQLVGVVLVCRSSREFRDSILRRREITY
jgi:hypothetical protein